MTDPESPIGESPDCLNCGTRLRGQYCAACGQRSGTRLISLWGLMREAFGDLLELDSRLWRTVGPLLGKPGHLTKEYLIGRRARYMPPFRTYLVLSVIFFVVVFFDPRDDFGLFFEPEPEPTAEEIAKIQKEEIAAKKEHEAEIQTARERLEKLADEGIIAADVAESFDGDGFNINIDDNGENDCELNEDEWNDLPEWLARRLTKERLQEICDTISFDDGESFLNLLADKIPVALIVLLPIMAFVLKILYPLSRRYFVEHLLFFIHYHAFFFLILTLQNLFYGLVHILNLPSAIPILITVAASFYIPAYLYLALRRVYQQGHLLTLTKYILLLIAYVTGASLTLLGAVVVALASV